MRECKHATFTAADINQHLDFDSVGYLRLLTRRGFLSTGGEKATQGARYARTGIWPPPAEFFNRGPIGFVYYLQTWFRFHLREWIKDRVSELETREGVYSIEGRTERLGRFFEGSTGHFEAQLLQADGNLTDAYGNTLAADMTLVDNPMDVTRMTLEWVQETTDPLFADLARGERLLLYQVFAREMPWSDIALSRGINVRSLKTQYEDIIARLQSKVTEHQELVQRRKAA